MRPRLPLLATLARCGPTPGSAGTACAYALRSLIGASPLASMSSRQPWRLHHQTALFQTMSRKRRWSHTGGVVDDSGPAPTHGRRSSQTCQNLQFCSPVESEILVPKQYWTVEYLRIDLLGQVVSCDGWRPFVTHRFSPRGHKSRSLLSSLIARSQRQCRHQMRRFNTMSIEQ
nr:hypothetical protein CFP56_16222 [Quercus suber]